MDKTLLIVGAAAAGLYFLSRRPVAASTPAYGPGYAPASSGPASSAPSPFAALRSVSRLATGTYKDAAFVKAPGSTPSPSAPSIGAKDLVVAGGAAAAAAGCAAIPGVGALASPLCASAGGYLADKGYEYGAKAADKVGSAIKDAWNSIF